MPDLVTTTDAPGEQMLLFGGTEARARARRTPPAQPASETSRAGGKHISNETPTLRDVIEALMIEVGERGLTIEEIAPRVSVRRGLPTKETTVCGRIAGANAELGDIVIKSGRTRRNASGCEADVYVHAMFRRSTHATSD